MHEMQALLGAHGIRLRKRLGQHFLVNPHVLRAIVEAAQICPHDHVVEIGAGIGILTKELLTHAGKVTAIELDRRLIPLLHEYVAEPKSEGRNPKLNIIHGDVLRLSMPGEPYKVVANIPYEITSPLLRHLLLDGRPPASLTLLIQREVAERICIPVGARSHAGDPASAKATAGKHTSLLAILVQLFGTPRMVRRVPPSVFLPPPKVESAILHIECFTEALADRETINEVLHLAKFAFGKKRKMLRSSLGRFHGLMERLKAASIDPQRRPETVRIEEWLTLARTKE